jgi:SAM-dependent methyltransferase
MVKPEARLAADSNLAYYNQKSRERFPEDAPHLKYAALRNLYVRLADQVCAYASAQNPAFRVLDLGAGTGVTTLPYLERGATVTAVDISARQLSVLQENCQAYGGHLTVYCQEIEEFIHSAPGPYEVVLATSFMHHIPDYLGLLKECLPLFAAHGQFFAFQDPLCYDRLGRTTLVFSSVAYLTWRITRGDLAGGFARRWRRTRGIYPEGPSPDNAEYHVNRNGVDQRAIADLFRQEGFQVETVRYFSTHNALLQPLGTALHLDNTFGLIARR